MMEDQSEEIAYQFERNQLDYFAENPFLLEAPQIAFQEDFFPSKIQKEYKIPISLSPLPSQNMHEIPYASKLQLLMKKKVRAGIQIMFGLSKESNQSGFLQDIDTKIFQDSSSLVDLNKLFQQECSSYSHHNSSIEELTTKMADIQKKAFNGVCMNKTIGKAFYEHFENFVDLQNESDFLKKFNLAFSKLLSDNYKLKNPGMTLILSIYEFWMRMFRDFIRQIWKHSGKFSMDLARQRHEHQKVYSSKSSTSQSQLGQRFQKDKRKPWKKDEIESLEKIIESNGILNQARLNKLSEELGRTPSSISSKIQKMTKLKKIYKEEQIEEECVSLDKKIELILKRHPNGLSKQEVVLKLSQLYDMGEEENWKKSVSQLLSSKKEIEKHKGTYSLISPNLIKVSFPANTMKDKLINCFFQIQNCDADLRTLTQVYLRLFGEQQDINPSDKQKIKALQMSISKTLCRYDIFNKDKSKTMYKLCDTKIIQNMQIEEFLL